MNRIVAQLQQAWDGRTRREQQMLIGMALLATAVVLWLGVIRPLNAWRDEAGRDRARAEADRVEVQAALGRLAPTAGGAPRGADVQGLEPVLQQTATAAGLELTTGMDASGRLGFRIARASSSEVFGWLAALETTHGLQPASLGVIENADASLQVEGAF
ncbi:MAG: type II secretion system protein GspM [Pseudomonadota bacterium]|nr:type II secretion system protein GspM [Pseudomonadota bacterium]